MGLLYNGCESSPCDEMELKLYLSELQTLLQVQTDISTFKDTRYYKDCKLCELPLSHTLEQ